MAEAMHSVWKVIPGLYARDLNITAKFYTEVLHFKLAELSDKGHENGPVFCSIYAGEKAVVNIYITKDPETKPSPGWVVIAMGTTELDEYYQALLEDGRASIVEEITDKDWGWRKFTVADPDNNRLTFFRFLEGGNPGTE